MKIIWVALLACSCAVMCDVSAAQPCTAEPGCDRGGSSSSFSREVGVVEDVIALREDGYQFRAYVVGWQGSRVLVSDPLAQSDRAEGDNLQFLAMRLDVNGKRMLAFTTDERASSSPASTTRPAPPAPPARLAQPGSVRDSSVTASGVVEDVLSAQDGAYRFVGYIVRYQNRRIALVDHLLGPPHAIGDEIGFLAMRAALSQRHLLGFEMLPGSAGVANSGTTRAERGAPESGIVTDVLSAQVDGYRYHAYVVQWHDGALLVPDDSANTDYRVGDTLSFMARRLQLPALPRPQRLVSFALSPSPGVTEPATADASAALATQTVPVTVEQVLSGDMDGYRYGAYVVEWNGLRLGVTDAFATTHYAVGQRISVPVSRVETGGSKRLMLTLFEFPMNCSTGAAGSCPPSN